MDTFEFWWRAACFLIIWYCLMDWAVDEARKIEEEDFE